MRRQRSQQLTIFAAVRLLRFSFAQQHDSDESLLDEKRHEQIRIGAREPIAFVFGQTPHQRTRVTSVQIERLCIRREQRRQRAAVRQSEHISRRRAVSESALERDALRIEMPERHMLRMQRAIDFLERRARESENVGAVADQRDDMQEQLARAIFPLGELTKSETAGVPVISDAIESLRWM